VKNKIDMQPVCEMCGTPQKPDEKESNENWQVFDCREHCECGGKFVPRILLDGKRKSSH